MKDQAYYRALPYTRRIEVVEDDGREYFVASIPELPGVRADGRNHIEALYHLDGAFSDYLDAMMEWGEEIPEPRLWPGDIEVRQPVHAPVHVEQILGELGPSPNWSAIAWREAAPRWRVLHEGASTRG